MRVAQLGAGRIGAMHAEILAGLVEPGSLIVADLEPERAQAVAARVGAEASEIDDAIAAADAAARERERELNPEVRVVALAAGGTLRDLAIPTRSPRAGRAGRHPHRSRIR